MTTKLRVGRPRKPDPFDWLREADPAVDAIFAAFGIAPNITRGTITQTKLDVEENRRERVGEGVRSAFAQGRNTANKTREKIARGNLERAVRENADLIFNLHISPSAAVQRIEARGKTFGAGRRALWKYIVASRKSLPGQMA